jgi:hypothetical protein
MDRLPRLVGYFAIIAGAVMILVGGVCYLLVQRELEDEKIVVSDDAESFAGDEVDGPFTAYSEAMIIKVHALEAADGLTYAQLDREDERRATVQSSSFLRASLFTSVLAFGVATLVAGLGLWSILLGLAILALDRRYRQVVVPVERSAPAVA